MRTCAQVRTLLLLLPLLAAGGARAETIIPGGSINGGTWTAAGSPYVVEGDLTINSLTIQPGVTVEIDSAVGITVAGDFSAVGTEADSIVFTRRDSLYGWGGMLFENNIGFGAELRYCQIRGSVNSGLRIRNSDTSVRNCFIAENAAEQGGGVLIQMTSGAAPSSFKLSDCVIRGNHATTSGGGAAFLVNADAATDTIFLTHCRIDDNFASSQAGGVMASMSATVLYLEQCSVSFDTVGAPTASGSRVAGGIRATSSGSGALVLQNCLVEGNACYSYCNGAGCSISGLGGGIHNAGRMVVRNTRFRSNRLQAYEGSSHGFSGENSYSYGGGIYHKSGSATIVNCLFDENVSYAPGSRPHPYGGGLYVDNDSAEVINCTFAYNTPEAVYVGTAGLIAKNSIFFFNPEGGTGEQILGTITNSPAVTYCDVQTGFDEPEFSNLHSNPVFLDPPDNLFIASNSPCVDAGDPAAEYEDECIAPNGISWGAPRNDIGASGGPGACLENGFIVCPTEGAPSAPTGLAAASDTDFVDLSWSANCEADVDEYRVFRGTTENPTASIAAVSAGTTTYRDEAVTIGTKYYYRLKAHDTEGLLSDYSKQVFITPGPRPLAPDSLVAVAGYQKVTLTWRANPAGEGVASYRVYRETSAEPTTQVGTATAGTASIVTFTDTGVANDTTYHYRVTAVSGAGIEGDFSSEVTATPGDYTPPAAPTNLKAVAGNGVVNLTWDSNVETDLAGYYLLRGETAAPTTAIDTVGPSGSATVSYADTSVANGVTYHYRLQAFDMRRNVSGYSWEKSATPQGYVDLSVVKSVDVAAPDVGDVVTFTVAVTNDGPEQATGVHVWDELPDGLAYQWSTPGMDYADGLWNVGTLSIGVTATLDVQALVERPGTIVNRADVIALDQTDTEPSNDADSASVTGLQADLALSKGVDVVSPAVGDTVTYTVTLRNDGPSDGTGIAVTDNVPAGVSFLSHTATAGSYDGSVWTVGAVADGSTETLEVRALVLASGSHVNTASVTATGRHDPNPGNDVASVTVSDSLADLALLLQVDEDRPNLGDTITMTLRIDNDGPWQSTGITVLCGEPSGLTFLDVTPSVGHYNMGIWYLDGLSSGAGAVLVIHARIDTRAEIVHTATITRSGLADPASANNQASVTVSVNTAPIILTSAIPGWNAKSPMPVDAAITDDGAVGAARVYYRLGGNTAWSEAVMSVVSGSTYRGTIPADSVTMRGLCYYVKAEDQDGAFRQTPTHYTRVNASTLVNPRTQASGPDEIDYRLVSVPIDLDDPDPAAVLADPFGAEYDTTRWRLFGLTVGQEYVEHPNTEDFEPGRAFWFATNLTEKRFSTGTGRSLPLDQEFSFNLVPGWNFVGSPFDFPIPAGRARLESGADPDFREYEENWESFDDTLRPFEGYAVYANDTDRLIIDPNPEGKGFAGKSSDDAPVPDWMIRVLATAGDRRDGDNAAALVPGARPDWDESDRAEPPVIGKYLTVYFPHRDWKTPAKRFRVDARPEIGRGETWNFEVTTNVREPVRLRFGGIDEIPEDLEVWLVDDGLRVSQDLRRSAEYVLPKASEEKPGRFRLIVGSREYVDEEHENDGLVPARYVLEPNFPNPFNPTTTIRFGIPRRESVALRIYNVQGRQVATLLDRVPMEAGYHAVVWDGRSAAGRPAASGVYLYRLTAGDFVQTRKMVLVR